MLLGAGQRDELVQALAADRDRPAAGVRAGAARPHRIKQQAAVIVVQLEGKPNFEKLFTIGRNMEQLAQ